MHVSFYCTLLYIMQELNADCIMSESHNVQHGWCLALFAQWLVWVFIRATARTNASVSGCFLCHTRKKARTLCHGVTDILYLWGPNPAVSKKYFWIHVTL